MSHDRYRAVLVLGGIRSGKSGYAESLVSRQTEVRYVATSAPDPGDPEWTSRLEEHRSRRPESWVTEEIDADPGRLAAILAEAKPDQTVLVDDLGGWMTALLSRAGWVADAVADPVGALADAVRDCAARLVVVSPEVGLSVVPATGAGRAFADALGTANRALADVCDAVVLVVAGQPTWLKRGTPGARIVPVLSRGRTVTPTPSVVSAPPVAGGDDELTIGPGLNLPLPDQDIAVQAGDRLLELDLPGAGLGALASVVSFAAGVQGTVTPGPFQAVRVLLLHGAHEGGLAAGDSAPDWDRRLEQLTEGGGPLGLLAGQAGASVQVVDLAVAGLPSAAPVELRDAARATEVDEALLYGWRFAEDRARAARPRPGDPEPALAAAGRPRRPPGHRVRGRRTRPDPGRRAEAGSG